MLGTSVPDTHHCNCSELHEAQAVVPLPIREYIKEVQSHLEYLTAYTGPELQLAEKLNFLRETRHAFGRTALVLSGGGALGAFHVVCFAEMRPLCPMPLAQGGHIATDKYWHGWQGVVKALFTQEYLPRVISGSSVGSIGMPP